MQEYAYSKRFMGTDTSVSVVTPNETLAKKISAEAFGVISDYEKQFSRFSPSSELSHLNSTKNMRVSEEFFTVFEKSFALFQETKGAFNPLVQISRQGYATDYQTLTKNNHVAKNEPYNIDFNSVESNKKTLRITLQTDQQLDFGGILKGYLATKLAHELREKYKECTGLIINLGGDLHTLGLDERGNPFTFYLYNPVNNEEKPTPFTDTSLVTSGSYKRVWQTDKGLRHHILDPEGIRNPNTDILSVSIAHKDGAVAETYATLFLVRGLAEAKKVVDTDTFTYFFVNNEGKTSTNII